MKTLDCPTSRTVIETSPFRKGGSQYEYEKYCHGIMAQTEWRPDDGRDPLLREYICGSCGHIEYLVDDNSYLRKVGLRGGR